MKNLITIVLGLLCLLTPITTSAALPVVDVGVISTNLTNSKRDLLQQILQEGNQQVQIQHLITQIRHADNLLKRLGRLEDVKNLPGFRREAEAFLKELEINLPSLDIIRNIKPDELFRQKKESPYEQINKDIIIDGKKVSEIDGNTVKPELAARRTISQYQQIRTKVLAKRSKLKGELEISMHQLKTATTTAQVQKLSAIINALNIQIAATDSDMRFAATEVQTRYYQNLIEESIQQKVRLQKNRAALKSGMKNHLEFFRLPSQPALFKPNK